MTISQVATGGTISHNDLDQLINILQQPSGGQETGHYKLEQNMYSTSVFVSCCLVTLSRNSAPVSCSVDTADDAAVGVNTLTTSHLTSGGVQINAKCVTAGTDGHCGGNYIMQY